MPHNSGSKGRGARPEVLRTRKRVYLNNVLPARRLERKALGEFSVADLLILRPAKKFVLHEAAHRTAHELTETVGDGMSSLHEVRARVFDILLSDAFANAVEAFEAIFVKDRAHFFFYQLNSNGSESRVRKIRLPPGQGPERRGKNDADRGRAASLLEP